MEAHAHEDLILQKLSACPSSPRWAIKQMQKYDEASQVGTKNASSLCKSLLQAATTPSYCMSSSWVCALQSTDLCFSPAVPRSADVWHAKALTAYETELHGTNETKMNAEPSIGRTARVT
ncbi:hypothetical protein O181_041342 [Austropuccinia psidii MF-1]|uniref:Uncharacterized protein n=1 Tax=Austropuccinia psidii MF-1 TaxID=1389203 RepID=A0A9Q3HER9_9BASI|nr:hypothetical protein [Austropuccinia psidii MF-1]